MGESKIKNATSVDRYGLHFRSRLECYTYEAFIKAGIPVEYEPKRYELLPKFEYLGEKLRPMVYTPDFVGDGFIVECKGFANDAFPLRWKLFKYTLMKNQSTTKLYLVRNHKQVDEMIAELTKR